MAAAAADPPPGIVLPGKDAIQIAGRSLGNFKSSQVTTEYSVVDGAENFKLTTGVNVCLVTQVTSIKEPMTRKEFAEAFYKNMIVTQGPKARVMKTSAAGASGTSQEMTVYLSPYKRKQDANTDETLVELDEKIPLHIQCYPVNPKIVPKGDQVRINPGDTLTFVIAGKTYRVHV